MTRSNPKRGGSAGDGLAAFPVRQAALQPKALKNRAWRQPTAPDAVERTRSSFAAGANPPAHGARLRVTDGLRCAIARFTHLAEEQAC
jgi:hypothetical protein